MWVARDEDGTLQVFYKYPSRTIINEQDYNDCVNAIKDNDELQKFLLSHNKKGGYWQTISVLSYFDENDLSYSSMRLDSSLFPDITWKDDPVEVELKIK